MRVSRILSRRQALTSVVVFTASVALSVSTVSATPFSITTVLAPTASGRSLAAGETGTVAATGSLTVTGSTVAVTITGNSATLSNLGTISQTGTGRVIRDNTGVTGLVINNGSTTNSTALMQAADADVIQMNKTPASVTLNNYGTMSSLNASKGGAQAVDFNAIQSGSNVVNNFSTGTLVANDADAVRPGVNGVVNNNGRILATHTTDPSDDGIDAQSNSGVIINNLQTDSLVTPTISGARHGITGGNTDPTVNGGAFTMTVTNGTGALVAGNNGSGINIDGINNQEIVTIVNNGVITGNGVTGDGDGVDVDGLVMLMNAGTIRSLNALNDTSEGVTVGGGTIINSGTIQGSISAPLNNIGTGRGITIGGVDKDANDNPIPVQAPYGALMLTNSGLIRGDSDSGIAFTSALAGGFTNTITNTATGTIEGGGTAVAIQTGADRDIINNSGLIKADTSGKAINMGAGDDTLNFFGGSILGSIDGGTGSNDLNIFGGALVASGDASISNFDLNLAGGTLDLNDFSELLASLSVSGSSTIDFGHLGGGSNLIDFSAIGTHAGGVLQLWDYDFGRDHLYFSVLDPSTFMSTFRSLYLPTDICFDGLCGYNIVSVNSIASGTSNFEIVSDAVPEPTTLCLLGFGLAGLALRRRRAGRSPLR